jgi:hypothetical protein
MLQTAPFFVWQFFYFNNSFLSFVVRIVSLFDFNFLFRSNNVFKQLDKRCGGGLCPWAFHHEIGIWIWIGIGVGLVCASEVGLVYASEVGLVCASEVGLVCVSEVGLVCVSEVGFVSVCYYRRIVDRLACLCDCAPTLLGKGHDMAAERVSLGR